MERNALGRHLLWLSALLIAAPPVFAETAEKSLEPILEEYCFDCHDPETKKGEVDLVGMLKQKPLVRNLESWERVMEALREKKMPPKRKAQPSEAERQQVLSTLNQSIHEFDYSTVNDPGFEPATRLTHQQYNNTMRDLFGVDLEPASKFPSELTGESGFDNSANTLFLQTALMERYIAAAERVVEVSLPAEPTTAEHRRARELIFVAYPDDSTSEKKAAEKVLDRFLLRAYRRPPSQEELDQAVRQFEIRRTESDDFEDAIRQVLQATLISPKFLLRTEAGNAGDEPYRINDWELASRLSYFLWFTTPDDELFELASQGRLHEPEVLSEQVARMMADPKANTLGDVFAAQWLGFRYVGTRIRLDPIDNPWCTDSLMSAMRAETSMFFMSLLRENQSITRLIDARYTFLNEELAKTLYKIEGISGDHMRRVELDDPNRGGLLGQPSVLTVTSSYKTTSPVKRGNWILENVLGTPPPPPPPDAGEIAPEIRRNRKLTFKEKLEQHASDPSCRGCHSKIDPLGLSLENFDYFGRWRDSYRTRRRRRGQQRKPTPIDASATLPDGTSFEGPSGLKQFLIEKRHDDLVRNVVEKMLAYALGRQLEYYDEPAVRKIIAALEADDYRFQTLLHGVVTSFPFHYKKNPTEESTP